MSVKILECVAMRNWNLIGEAQRVWQEKEVKRKKEMFKNVSYVQK